MTPNDAQQLALAVIRPWPRNSVPGDIWQDVLSPLDFNRAREAIRQLVDECESAPSVARFRHVYKALHSSRDETEARDASSGCSACSGEGFVTGSFWNHGIEYSAPVPCECPAGRLLEPSHSRLLQQRSDDRRAAALPHHTPTVTRRRPDTKSHAAGQPISLKEHIEKLRRAAVLGDEVAAERLRDWLTDGAAHAIRLDDEERRSIALAVETAEDW